MGHGIAYGLFTSAVLSLLLAGIRLFVFYKSEKTAGWEATWFGFFLASAIALPALIVWSPMPSVAVLVAVALALNTKIRTLRLLNPMGMLVILTAYIPLSYAVVYMIVSGFEQGWPILVTLAVMMGLYILAAGGWLSSLLHAPQLNMHFPKRDRAQQLLSTENSYGKVCIHLPCYAEPPSMVNATIDSIYKKLTDNAFLFVIDNNTKDPSLWKPVENHCCTHNRNVVFMHVDSVEGAKAGALNLAMAQSVSNTEFIAVVDADYLVEEDFFNRYQILLREDNAAFVQLSHDYHSFNENPFLGGAYHAYTAFHKMGLPALNEYDAGFTVGTMCLFRRDALEAVGGWAEWCVTEDSEVAIRLGLAGYTGHAFGDTSGRGLLPETFSAVKKQQFRWASGPIQQLLHYLPSYIKELRKGNVSKLRVLLSIRNHLHYLPILFFHLSTVAFLTVVPVIIKTDVPREIGTAVLVYFISTLVLLFVNRWITFRLMGGQLKRDYLNSILVQWGLQWTHMWATLAPLIGHRLLWIRTNKNKETTSFNRAFSSVKGEIAATLLMAGLTAACFMQFRATLPMFCLLATIFGIFSTIRFLSSIWVSILSEVCLSRSAQCKDGIPYAQ